MAIRGRVSVAAGALLLAATTPAVAGVNCGIIKKDIEMGRTPQDISERMIIPIEEVQKCLDAEGGKTATTESVKSDGAEEKQAEE